MRTEDYSRLDAITHHSSRMQPTESPVQEIVAEIRQYGSSVIRNAWDADRLLEIRSAIVALRAQREKRIAAGYVAAPTERMFHTHGIGTAVELVQAGLLKPDFVFRLFKDSKYQSICEAYFNDTELYVAPNRLAFRFHDPALSDRSFIPYHQDSYTQDSRVLHVLNCWIPLDSGAGRVCPGLEVVRTPCRADFPRKNLGLKSENAAYDFITIDRSDIVDAYGDNFLAPVCEIGDGIVFSENVIHRTYVAPGMKLPRINFELRIFSPKSLAAGVTMRELGEDAIRIS